MSAEEWRGVLGFSLYQVSSLGRVRRHPDHPSHLPREALSAPAGSNGYPCVRLMRERKPHWRMVHILVCEAFHGPKPSPDHEVAHGDGDRTNPSADNLRWATRQENHADKKRHGTNRRGQDIPWARLTDSAVRQIRARLTSGEEVRAIAEDYGVSTGAVDGIRTGKNWKHVTTEQEKPR